MQRYVYNITFTALYSKLTELFMRDRTIMANDKTALDQEALAFHENGRPGKLEITPTKPLASQRDLSLAYSPGVAAPCLAIEAD